MDTNGIGARVRTVRQAKGLTLDTVAGLAGISRSALWAYEQGERPLNRLTKIDAIAAALGVSRAWLLGQPVEPNTRELAALHGSTQRMRETLISLEIGERPDVDPRPLPVLLQVAQDASRLGIGHGELNSAAGRLLPDILTELHAWAVDGDEKQQTEALQGLVISYANACAVIKWAGSQDLSWIAASMGRQAARRLGDPVYQGLAEFYCSHALAPYAKSLWNSERAVDALQPHVGDDLLAMQVYGMLHQMAAFGAAVVGGREDEVRAHLDEAAGLAGRTGDRTDFHLWFGPTNLGIWRVSIAVEQGEGGRATEVARKHDVRPMPSVARQASYLIDVGRGFAQERRDEQALNSFLAAEKLAPQITTNSPLVRETTGHILRRAVRSAGGTQLRSFARRVGVAP